MCDNFLLKTPVFCTNFLFNMKLQLQSVTTVHTRLGEARC